VSEPILTCRNLSRWYGDVIGLNDVTVDIGPGITGLLGPNGAGKSSFLRMASGELRVSDGEIRVLGEKPFANPKLFGRMGYCPEGDRFFDRMRGRDFVVHLLRMSGYSRSDAKDLADQSLQDTGMSYAAGTRLGACSKGMRQRFKLAQAIAHHPEILLLDEPLTGLDPLARHQTQDLLLARAAEGVSIIISSHVLHEVESLTNRILLVNKGFMAATGEVSEIRGLMDSHPHRIRLQCEDRRRLAGLLVGRPDVLSLSFPDDVLQIETNDPDAFHDALPGLLVTNDLPVTGISSPDDRLEAVFDILVNGGNR
jgi:ABC-2 type transport system ATP-binding protein